MRSRATNALVAVSPTEAVIPPKARAARFTTPVLPLHAVRVKALEWASGTDVSIHRDTGFTLTAMGVGFVPAQLGLSCTPIKFGAASPGFLALNKSLQVVKQFELCFSLRYAADPVQGQPSAFLI